MMTSPASSRQLLNFSTEKFSGSDTGTPLNDVDFKRRMADWWGGADGDCPGQEATRRLATKVEPTSNKLHRNRDAASMVTHWLPGREAGADGLHLEACHTRESAWCQSISLSSPTNERSSRQPANSG